MRYKTQHAPEFGWTMRAWRFRHQLTQGAAAAQIGRTAGEWARWERGEVFPEHRTHQQIRALLAGEPPYDTVKRIESGRPRMIASGDRRGQG